MNLDQYEKELTDGLRELQQNLNNVRSDIMELDQARTNLEARILSQQGALALLAKLKEEETEEIDDG